MAKLADVRVEEGAWSKAPPLRRAEWRAACEDLAADACFADMLEGRYLLASPSPETVRLEVLDEEGVVVHAFTISRDALAASIDEYVAIIRRLDEGTSQRDASWFEVVDMAKRVVHDQAARRLALEVPAISTELATLRKVFTLVLALFVDTTALQHTGHSRRLSPR
jgi:uncharacterized protein (UPF0262 family)